MNPRTFIARATLLYVAVALTAGIARAQSPIVIQNTSTADFGPNTNIFAFADGSVNFYAAFDGLPVITNQWVYSSSGSGFTAIDGATGNLYMLNNVQSGSAGWYQYYATNGYGSSNSTPAHLTALANPGAPNNIGTNAYSYCIYTNHPWAYWKFEETNDSLKNSMQAYDYSGNNFDATYGNSVANDGGCRDGGKAWANGQGGPGSSRSSEAYGADHYAGFPSTNACAQLSYNHHNGYLTVPPLNLNTNTVTFTMWIYPNSDVIAAGTGLLMNRNGNDGAGIGFGSVLQTNSGGRSMPCLSYTWNSNNPATYGWNSGLYPVGAVWSFVACVVTPTNTTMYLYYVTSGTTNVLKSSFVMTNNPEAFGGIASTRIGGDSAGGDGLTFDGCIDEVAVFTNAMSESQIQDLFLKSLGLFTGVAPAITTQPTNVTMYFYTTLQLTAVASGILNPAYQWQFSWDKIHWTNVVNNPSIGVGEATDTTLHMTNYPDFSYSGITNYRCIAANLSGIATSSVATVTLIPLPWPKVEWTVNFAITTTNGGGTGVPFYGHGVLGMGSYWNALQGGQFTNATSYRDDGPTVIGVHFGSTNFGLASASFGGNNALLDTYCIFGNGGTAFVFTSVPNGKYNLALYGIDGAYANRGTIFTVNGVSQSVTNAQDIVILPDNTAIFTNVLVSNGRLEVDMMPVPSVPSHNPNTEGEFNGAQLQLLKYAPQPLPIEPITNDLFTLTWVGGGLWEATNVMGPWVTNPAVSPYTFAPTGAQRFFRIVNYHFP